MPTISHTNVPLQLWREGLPFSTVKASQMDLLIYPPIVFAAFITKGTVLVTLMLILIRHSKGHFSMKSNRASDIHFVLLLVDQMLIVACVLGSLYYPNLRLLILILHYGVTIFTHPVDLRYP